MRAKSGNLSVIQLFVSVPEINTLQQKAKLLAGNLCCLRLICRPGELVLLQALQPLCKVRSYAKKVSAALSAPWETELPRVSQLRIKSGPAQLRSSAHRVSAPDCDTLRRWEMGNRLTTLWRCVSGSNQRS